jgi:Bifunctional DNA primase/polymerase, N-terminal/Primase C terminal 1 (PriCT-1)
VIEIALHHASQGFFVFPVVSNGKVPAIPKERGGRGCLDATWDVGRIERFWAEYPDANIGIATGNGLLVIDVDPRKSEGWLESLNSLELPPTFAVKTPNGWHLYFSMPRTAGITIGTNLLEGIDWRGDRGYVLGVGSVVGGVTYTIAKSLPIAPAPESLLKRIRAARRAKRRIQRDETGRMVINAGGRNDTLMRIAFSLRHFGIELNAIYEALRAVNHDHCEPCLGDEELRSIAACVAQYPPVKPESDAAAGSA